MEPV
jgi:hypothetical protein